MKARANHWQPTTCNTTFTCRFIASFRNTWAYINKCNSITPEVTLCCSFPPPSLLYHLYSLHSAYCCFKAMIDPLVPRRWSPRAVQSCGVKYYSSYKIPTSVPHLRLTSKKGLTIRQLAWLFGPKFLHRRGKSVIHLRYSIICLWVLSKCLLPVMIILPKFMHYDDYTKLDYLWHSSYLQTARYHTWYHRAACVAKQLFRGQRQPC